MILPLPPTLTFSKREKFDHEKSICYYPFLRSNDNSKMKIKLIKITFTIHTWKFYEVLKFFKVTPNIYHKIKIMTYLNRGKKNKNKINRKFFY